MFKIFINNVLMSGSKDDPLTIRYFARPASYYLFFLIKNTFTANQITYFRGLLLLIALIFFLLNSNIFFVLAILLFLLNIILDCLDGHIARINNNASYFGKFLDGYIDTLWYLIIPLSGCLRLLIHDSQNSNTLIIVMILASILFLTETTLRERISFYREWIKNNKVKDLNSFFYKNKPNTFLSRSFFDLVHILSVLSIIFISSNFYFLIISILYIIISAIRIILQLLVAAKYFKIFRKSIFKSEKDLS